MKNPFKNSALNKQIFILGLVSLFTDISSEMILPLIPLFLSGVLLADVSIIGLIEGVAESTSNILKGISGFLTDRVKRKKDLVYLGYGLSSVSKPVIAFAGMWQIVLGARFGDRIGKGIRTSPRDFLLSSSADEKHQGIAFGLHRAMDTSGALIGSILALLLLIFLSYNNDVYRIAFLASFIPAIIGVGLIFFFKEKDVQKKSETINKVNISLPNEFKVFILVSLFFGFVQVAPAFFILRSQEIFNVSKTSFWIFSGPIAGAIFAVFGFLVYNFIYAITAIKLGSLSDRFGRLPVIISGLILFAGILLFFAFIPIFNAPLLVIIAMALYGLYIASTEGILKAFVADMTKGELIKRRGTAYGWFNLTIGIAALGSSVTFGIVSQMMGIGHAFFIFGILTILPISLLIIYNKTYNRTLKAMQ
ncbi:MAG: MFS transporter [Candidatus Thorarchaeota archaeon]